MLDEGTGAASLIDQTRTFSAEQVQTQRDQSKVASEGRSANMLSYILPQQKVENATQQQANIILNPHANIFDCTHASFIPPATITPTGATPKTSISQTLNIHQGLPPPVGPTFSNPTLSNLQPPPTGPPLVNLQPTSRSLVRDSELALSFWQHAPEM